MNKPFFYVTTSSMQLRSACISVGTDCSGLDAVREALTGVCFRYEFASDICPIVRDLLVKGEARPTVIYDDITTRDVKQVPSVDLYVAGFPCQPYSLIGSGRGLADNRADVFLSVMEYIKERRPKSFLLENVRNILFQDKGAAWQHVWHDNLKGLTEYKVEYKVLSPEDYGWPQARRRVFIIGRLKQLASTPFEWPVRGATTFDTLDTLLLPFARAVELHPSCARPLAPSYTRSLGVLVERAVKRNQDFDQPHVVMLGQSKGWEESGGRPIGVACCMTTNSGNAYVPYQRRFLCPEETLLLQGFAIDHPASTLPAQKLRILTGNSIHVGLLKLILAPLVSQLSTSHG
jgi:DNA (cytosine-5)-methyltransferase 1